MFASTSTTTLCCDDAIQSLVVFDRLRNEDATGRGTKIPCLLQRLREFRRRHPVVPQVPAAEPTVLSLSHLAPGAPETIVSRREAAY